VDYFARIPVSGGGYTVKDAKFQSVDAQVSVFSLYYFTATFSHGTYDLVKFATYP